MAYDGYDDISDHPAVVCDGVLELQDEWWVVADQVGGVELNFNWNDGSEDYNKIWDLERRVKRLEELLRHVGCGSLDDAGLCVLCDEIRRILEKQN